MAEGVTLRLIKGSTTYDITQLVESVQWKGRKGSAARSLTVSLIDDSGYGHDRSGIDVEKGHQVIFYYDGKELFRGLIMTQTQGDNRRLKFTAYDNGIYLANNRDTFRYKQKTASDIFKDVCKRFSIPYSDVAKCSYQIKDLTKSKATAWDVICEALSTDYEQTKVRHYVSSKKGKLKLLKRKENILLWVLEAGGNLTAYSYTKSIEDIHTRIKIIANKDKTLASVKNAALEKKIGVFQGVESPDDKNISKGKAKKLAESLLKEQSTPERSLSLEAEGIASVITGVGVYAIIPDLNLKRCMWVDEDTHTFKNGHHSMKLTLNYARDL